MRKIEEGDVLVSRTGKTKVLITGTLNGVYSFIYLKSPTKSTGYVSVKPKLRVDTALREGSCDFDETTTVIKLLNEYEE